MINIIGLGPGDTGYITKLGETTYLFIRCSNWGKKKP